MSTITSYPVHVDAHLDPGLSAAGCGWSSGSSPSRTTSCWPSSGSPSGAQRGGVLRDPVHRPLPARRSSTSTSGCCAGRWRVASTPTAPSAPTATRRSRSERPDYPATLDVAYPAHLSRGLVLVKWWLLAIPHYLVVGLFLGGGWYVGGRRPVDGAGAGAGLIGLLVLFAAVVLLFTGRYPRAFRPRARHEPVGAPGRRLRRADDRPLPAVPARPGRRRPEPEPRRALAAGSAVDSPARGRRHPARHGTRRSASSALRPVPVGRRSGDRRGRGERHRDGVARPRPPGSRSAGRQQHLPRQRRLPDQPDPHVHLRRRTPSPPGRLEITSGLSGTDGTAMPCSATRR